MGKDGLSEPSEQQALVPLTSAWTLSSQRGAGLGPLCLEVDCFTAAAAGRGPTVRSDWPWPGVRKLGQPVGVAAAGAARLAPRGALSRMETVGGCIWGPAADGSCLHGGQSGIQGCAPPLPLPLIPPSAGSGPRVRVLPPWA